MGFEPRDRRHHNEAAFAGAESESRMASGFEPAFDLAPKLDMRGYSAIVGVFRQKCGFCLIEPTPGLRATYRLRT